jgi:hypothetical protein
MMKLLFACILCLVPAGMLCAFLPQRLSLPDDGAEPGDRFGSFVASSGDWAAVSAPGDTAGTGTSFPSYGHGYGSVYLYQRVGNEWLLRQKLMQQVSRIKQAYFGQRTTMDAGTLVVSCAGDAMIYKLSEGVWEYQTTLGDSELEILSIALRGNLVALSFGNTGMRRVRIFEGQAASWQESAVLTGQGGSGSEEFGTSLAIGNACVLVGAPGGAGRVDVFEQVASIWSRTGTLSQPDCQGFGSGLVVYGSRAMIAAPHFAPSQGTAVPGRICFYQQTQAGWELERALRPVPSTAERQIQDRISLSEGVAIFEATTNANSSYNLLTVDLEGASDTWLIRDSLGNVVADALTQPSAPGGAADPFLLNRNTSASALVAGELWAGVYQFGNVPWSSAQGVGFVQRRVRQGDAWVVPVAQDVLRPPRSQLQEATGFGTALMSGDLAVVTAPYYPNYGLVRTLRRVQGRWQWGLFGGLPITDKLLALSGNLLVTSRSFNNDSNRTRERVVTLYQHDGTDWAQGAEFQMEQSYGEVSSFEGGLALSGNTLAFSETTGAGTSSHVKVLQHDGSAWVEEARLSTPNHGRYAGALVALDGDLLAMTDRSGHTFVGARNMPPQGSLLLYHRQNGQWTLEATFAATPKALGVATQLEFSTQLLALRGNRVAVGSVSGGRYGVQVYERQGMKWKRLASPALPAGASPTSLSWAGDALLIETDKKPGNDAALWSLQGGTWKPSASLRSAVDAKDTIIARAASADTALMANRGEIIQDSFETWGRIFVAPDIPEVLFFDLGSVSVQDGPPNAAGAALADGSSLDFGSVMVGEKTTRLLSFTNNTPLPISLTGVSLSGAQAAEFKLSIPATTLKTGERRNFQVEHVPTSTGSREATLQMQSSGRPLSIHLTSQAVTQRMVPQITQQTQAFLRPEYEALTLAPAITGTHPYQCQWHKNGRAVSGATFPRLHLDSLKTTDAGLYRLIISSPSGKVEGPEIAVGVFRPLNQTITAKRGQEIVMKAYAWGPNLDWRWYAEESAFSRGSRTDTLRILNPEMQPDAWTATLQMRGAYAEPARYQIYVPEHPAPPSADWQGNWARGESVAGFRVSSGEESPRYLVSGLPPGVRLNATTGELSGAPSKAGAYRMEWRVQARGLTSEALVTHIFVNGAANISPGDFAGLIDQHEYLPKGGFASLSRTASGAYTVKLQIGSRITRLAGTLTPDFFERFHTLPTLPGTLKTLLQVTEADSLEVLFETAPDSFTSLRIGLRPVTADGVQSPPLTKKLTFTQPLQIAGGTFGSIGGAGFASIRMTRVKEANLVGTLPDGTGITASGPVASTYDTLPPKNHLLLIYHCPTATSGWVMGDINLQRLRGEYTEGTTARISWGFPTYETSAGLPEPVQLEGRGAPYFPPAPGMLLLPALMEPEFVLRQTFSSGGLLSDLVSWGRLTAAHRAVFDVPDLNRPSITFVPATGFFSGSVIPGGVTSQKISFKGMLNPYFNEGHGFFLKRGADGVVRSGNVLLDAAEKGAP